MCYEASTEIRTASIERRICRRKENKLIVGYIGMCCVINVEFGEFA